MEDRTWLLLVAVFVAVVLNTGVSGHLKNGSSMPGSLSNVSQDDPHLKQVLLVAVHNFNNRSNDMFLFKASAVRHAQRQIVKGVRYVVDADVSRTVCRKRQANVDLTKCELQPRGHLHQVFGCHGEFWLIPWENKTSIKSFSCNDKENN